MPAGGMVSMAEQLSENLSNGAAHFIGISSVFEAIF
jgi:hypothetical protein